MFRMTKVALLAVVLSVLTFRTELDGFCTRDIAPLLPDKVRTHTHTHIHTHTYTHTHTHTHTPHTQTDLNGCSHPHFSLIYTLHTCLSVLQSAEKVIKSFRGSPLQSLMGQWFGKRVSIIMCASNRRKLLIAVYTAKIVYIHVQYVLKCA